MFEDTAWRFGRGTGLYTRGMAKRKEGPNLCVPKI